MRRASWRCPVDEDPIDTATVAVGVIHVLDDDPPPTVVPGIGVVGEAAGDGALLHVPVTLSAPSGHDVTVAWRTGNVPDAPPGQALSPGDHQASSGSVRFAAHLGATEGVASIPIVDDQLVEGDEYVVVSFQVVSGGARMGGFWGLGFGSILDDDG